MKLNTKTNEELILELQELQVKYDDLSKAYRKNIENTKLINNNLQIENNKASISENHKIRTLFEAMTEMVVLHELVFDENGNPVNYRITDCNQAFTNITGLTREMAIGKLATELYGTEEPPYLEHFAKVAITGESYTYDSYFPPMDKHFSISVVSPEKNTFATITTDITSIKQIQQIIAIKNKELEQIVYVASHDLRSPLVNVDGYSREIKYSLDEISNALNSNDSSDNKFENTVRAELPEMLEAVTHIRKSTIQMDILLKGLLKLSRIGRSSISIGNINMNELISSIISNFEFQTKTNNIDLQFTNLPNCRGDVFQLTQVFSNLIENAIKYLSPEKSGKIILSGKVESGKCVYCVEDNGIGIAENHQDNIFELFHRLNPKDSEGEGLGLTIVRQILSRLDGEIRVESKLGIGSKFFVCLPLEKNN